jgi:hypothetical protein
MKFFKKWFANMCREAWENARDDKADKPSIANSLSPKSVDSIDSKGTRFTVYKADGGHVVETRTYDKNHDSQTSLYIVTSDQDLGERLAHIVTYEAIKR